MSMNAVVERECNEKHIREYFEQGCLCLIRGELQKVDSCIDDSEANVFYERNCSCSRNYLNVEG
jgi:hypothetical protein